MSKSLKLWSFYVDLEESLGTVETAKAVYDKILELRIANAQVIVNYAAFLEENKYYEESFKVNIPLRVVTAVPNTDAFLYDRCTSEGSSSAQSLCRSRFGTSIWRSLSSDMYVAFLWALE